MPGAVTVDVKINAELDKMMHEYYNDPARRAVVDLAKEAIGTMGRDLYGWAKSDFIPWIRTLLTAGSVDSWGFIRYDHRDRLLVRLRDVDDQAFAVINAEQVSARSLGQPARWDLARPLPVGTHMLVVRLRNNGRGAYGVTLDVAPKILLEKNLAKPTTNTSGGNDWLNYSERIYYMKVEVF